MASILALISRSVFRTLPVVWLDQVCPLGSYQSRQPAFGKLEPGDAVFVVTVPQHSDALWLVAILEQPVRRGGSIVGRTNTVPITDISAHKAALGITAKPRKLAMSLQTPRVLTADAEIGYDKEVLLKRATPRDPWSIARNHDSLGLVLPSLPAAELARVKAPRAGCAALEAARAQVARPKRR